MSEERMRILEMVAEGTITAEQASQLIHALDESGPEEDEAEYLDAAAAPEETVFEAASDAAPEADDFSAGSAQNPSGMASENMSDFRKFRGFWYIPLAIGIVLTAISGLLVYAGNQAAWHWFWMMCVWVPLLTGISIVVFAAMSRTAHWLHVRVHTGEDEWPRNIKISLPLPLGMTGLFFKAFGKRIPGISDVPIPLDEAISALKDSVSHDDPFYVQVDEADGAKVEVYIG